MHRRRKCISCNELIFKTAKSNAYMCRICEHEFKEMHVDFPTYFLEN